MIIGIKFVKEWEEYMEKVGGKGVDKNDAIIL